VVRWGQEIANFYMDQQESKERRDLIESLIFPNGIYDFKDKIFITKQIQTPNTLTPKHRPTNKQEVKLIQQ